MPFTAFLSQAVLTRHIPHLGLVRNTATEEASPSGPIAIIHSSVQIRHILQLLLQGELVERLAKGELPVDILLGDAKVGHVEETLGTDSLNELLSQLRSAFGRTIF